MVFVGSYPFLLGDETPPAIQDLWIFSDLVRQRLMKWLGGDRGNLALTSTRRSAWQFDGVQGLVTFVEIECLIQFVLEFT